jgi:hypothetical protein
MSGEGHQGTMDWGQADSGPVVNWIHRLHTRVFRKFHLTALTLFIGMASCHYGYVGHSCTHGCNCSADATAVYANLRVCAWSLRPDHNRTTSLGPILDFCHGLGVMKLLRLNWIVSCDSFSIATLQPPLPGTMRCQGSTSCWPGCPSSFTRHG